jgi:hypothetical protein
MKLPIELTPPAALFRKIPFPGWNGTVSIDHEPHVLRRLVATRDKETCLANRDAALANARACRIFECKSRAAARKEYGDAGGVNPCPVSGGLCTGWPREVSAEIMEALHAKQDWVALALAWHTLAGRRDHTFRHLPGVATLTAS